MSGAKALGKRPVQGHPASADLNLRECPTCSFPKALESKGINMHSIFEMRISAQPFAFHMWLFQLPGTTVKTEFQMYNQWGFSRQQPHHHCKKPLFISQVAFQRRCHDFLLESILESLPQNQLPCQVCTWIQIVADYTKAASPPEAFLS